MRSPAVTRTRRPTARRNCSGVRSGGSGPGDQTSAPYSSSRPASSRARVTAAQTSWSTPSGWSTTSAERAALAATTSPRAGPPPEGARAEHRLDTSARTASESGGRHGSPPPGNLRPRPQKRWVRHPPPSPPSSLPRGGETIAGSPPGPSSRRTGPRTPSGGHGEARRRPARAVAVPGVAPPAATPHVGALDPARALQRHQRLAHRGRRRPPVLVAEASRIRTSSTLQSRSGALASTASTTPPRSSTDHRARARARANSFVIPIPAPPSRKPSNAGILAQSRTCVRVRRGWGVSEGDARSIDVTPVAGLSHVDQVPMKRNSLVLRVISGT